MTFLDLWPYGILAMTLYLNPPTYNYLPYTLPISLLIGDLHV